MINVSSTFTCEPLDPYLSFWLKNFSLDRKIEYTPFNQVFQTLLSLDKKSTLPDFLAVLIRWEDWLDKSFSQDDKDRLTRKHIEEFYIAVKSAATQKDVHFIVCICPPSHKYPPPSLP